MTIADSITIGLRALAANKLRTALTMLGIIIGVAAVIALMSIGKGAQASVTSQIESMGTNLLFIRPGAQQQGGVRQQAGTAPTLTYDDALAIATLPDIVGVAPEAGGFAQIIAGGQNVATRIVGTTPSYVDVRNFHPAAGEFFTQQQLDSRALVIVLGANVAQTLFPGSDPVGQTVSVGLGQRRINFRVIGVMESKGSSPLGNQDDMALMPLTTLQQRLFPQRTARGSFTLSSINVQVASADALDRATEAIADLLRTRHRVVEDDFTIFSQRDILQTATQITMVMTILLGSIAGISLVVGGIGIMNIMLVSVTERTREIGIRKAVGAKRRDILLQFLIEAVVVSVLGGTVGIATGAGLSRIIAGISVNGQNIPALVSADSVALAFGVSAIVGLFFGIYPASRAARLNPIEALRYE